MRHQPNAFSRWLEASGRSVSDLADELGIAQVSVYHLRDGRFAAGRDLAVRIAELSGGSVPVSSWGPRPRQRARRRRATGRKSPAPEQAAPEPIAAPAPSQAVTPPVSDEALTLAFLLLEYVRDPTRTRPVKIHERDVDATAARWAMAIDELHSTQLAPFAKIQRAIVFAQRQGNPWRRKVNNGAALLRWWPELAAAIDG